MTVNAIRPSVSQSVLLRFFVQLVQNSFSFRIVLLLERDEIAGADTSVRADPTEGNLSRLQKFDQVWARNIVHVRGLLSRELGLHRHDGDGAAVRHLPSTSRNSSNASRGTTTETSGPPSEGRIPRQIPVHPALARLLADWQAAGWERTYGRPPTPTDLIVPTRNDTSRAKAEAQHALLQDLASLGLRPRRGHDLRRTFITLAQVDGARRDLLQTVTHGPRGDIVSVYTTFPWQALCAEVAKLQITLRDGPALEAFATALATAQLKGRRRWQKDVTPPGIEPGIAP
jgi:hypothetical protein